MIFLVEKYSSYRFLFKSAYSLHKGEKGLINWIKCKFPVILIRHCCHSKRSNTLFIDSS